MTVTEEAVQAIHSKCNNVFYREQTETWHCVGCKNPLPDDTLDSISKHQTAEMMRLLNGEQPSHKVAEVEAFLSATDPEKKTPRLTERAVNEVLAYHDLDSDTKSSLFMCQCGEGYQKWSDFITHQSAAVWYLLIEAGNREHQPSFLAKLFRRPRN